MPVQTSTTRAYAGLATAGSGSQRVIVTAVIAAAAACGVLATGADTSAQAVADAGPDLVRLMRAMAAIKALMAAMAAACVLWRLGEAATPGRLLAYAVACAAMAAGPGLIWGMAHVGAGALLLHGGLLAVVLLLWRDPAAGRRLDLALAARRRRQLVAPTSRTGRR